jgi:ATP-dependent HslUV protease ATP-binding subunit HslU
MSRHPLRPAEALTPRAIVEELDRYIVGPARAKRAVAVALRNRWRRQQVPPRMRDEIAPKNIMMIGPTGVGKTEIARRLARLAGAPFVKVEASKFTEVGYVGPRRRLDGARPGRDRRSRCCATRSASACAARPAKTPRSACWTCCCRPPAQHPRLPMASIARQLASAPPPTATRTTPPARACALLREGKLDDSTVEIDTTDTPTSFIDVFSGTGMEEMVLNLRTCSRNTKTTKRRRLKVPEALEALTEEEASKLVDMDRITKEADPPRRAGGHHLHRRDRQDRGRESGGTGPTSRARACSAICCPSSRARRCRPSTGRSRPTTCCSSLPGPSTSRSPRT